MNSGKFLLGVLAGAAAGALAGILFAPESGSKTRNKILKRGEDYSDALKKKLNDLHEAVTKKFKKVSEDVSDYSEKKLGKPEKAEKKTKTAKV
ncbi:MAG: YtxH domain-containing protein [Bacteroidota bacterium]|nr:YtxH domain-containing protein [Bacteroidota bacterium]